MSYTPPNTFTSGTAVDALDVRGNWQEARDYTNGLIAVADFDTDTLDTKHILRPDRIWTDNTFSESWKYTSGLIYCYSNKYDTDGAIFLTNHVKNAYFDSRVEYQDLSDMGQQIYVEHSPVRCIVKVYAHAVLGFNDPQTDNGDSNAFYLFVNGTKQDETVSYASYNGVGAGTPGTPDKTDSDLGDRFVPVCFIWSGTLGVGTYNFQVKCNPLGEYCVVRLRHFFLEVIN